VATTGAASDFLERDFLTGSAATGAGAGGATVTTAGVAAASVDFWLDLVTRGIFIYFTLSLSRLINEVFKQADFI
jgi:cobalamin biosynthesis protein CobD/CbiB